MGSACNPYKTQILYALSLSVSLIIKCFISVEKKLNRRGYLAKKTEMSNWSHQPFSSLFLRTTFLVCPLEGVNFFGETISLPFMEMLPSAIVHLITHCVFFFQYYMRQKVRSSVKIEVMQGGLYWWRIGRNVSRYTTHLDIINIFFLNCFSWGHRQTLLCDPSDLILRSLSLLAAKMSQSHVSLLISVWVQKRFWYPLLLSKEMMWITSCRFGNCPSPSHYPSHECTYVLSPPHSPFGVSWRWYRYLNWHWLNIHGVSVFRLGNTSKSSLKGRLVMNKSWDSYVRIPSANQNQD